MCERLAPPQIIALEQLVPPLTTPVSASVAAGPPPVAVPVALVTSFGEALQMTVAEQERMAERLACFRRFNPPTYDGSCTEAWVVKGWISAMEKLFENLFIYER